MEYIVGYFLADGWFRKHIAVNGSDSREDGHSIGYAETKDKELAENLSREYGNSSYISRVRTLGDVQCTIYNFSLNREVSDYIRSCQNNYKSFKCWYLSLNEYQQDNFIHGFFIGDGTICLRPQPSGKNQVYVGFTVSDIEVLEILEDYLSNRGIKYGISSDNRGAWLRNISITRSEDVLSLMLRWNKHKFLSRKDSKFVEAVKNKCWVRVFNSEESIISCDMTWLCEHFGVKRGVMSDMLRGVNRKTDLKFEYVHYDDISRMLLDDSEFEADTYLKIKNFMKGVVCQKH